MKAETFNIETDPKTDDIDELLNVGITDTRWYENTDTGYLHAMGKIHNNSPMPIRVIVRLEYLNANGEALIVHALGENNPYDRSVAIVPIPPDATGYFERTRPVDAIDGQVKDIIISTDDVLELKTAPVLEITDFSWEMSADGPIMTGMVKNTGNDNCPNPEVWAVFSQNNELITINKNNWLDVDVLAIGEDTQFRYTLYTAPNVFDDLTPMINCPQ